MSQRPHKYWGFRRLKYGGESGIRTHVTLSSKHAFQACAFSHSAISPQNEGLSSAALLKNAHALRGQHEPLRTVYQTPTVFDVRHREHPSLASLRVEMVTERQPNARTTSANGHSHERPGSERDWLQCCDSIREC